MVAPEQFISLAIWKWQHNIVTEGILPNQTSDESEQQWLHQVTARRHSSNKSSNLSNW